jgi:hypothetical protein
MSILKKICLSLFFIPLLLLLSGCSFVTTSQPLSSAPEPIDQDKFEGAWLSEEEVVFIRFAASGVAHLAGLDWKDDQFQMVQGELIIIRGEKGNYLSVRLQEEGEWQNRYYLIQYEFTDEGDLLLWFPNEDVFAKAVEDGLLQGEVKTERHRDDIFITDTPEKILRFIENPGPLRLFNTGEPLILKKVKAP